MASFEYFSSIELLYLKKYHQAWELSMVALGELRQENCELEVRLGYIARPCLKTNKNYLPASKM
jgi:hypothetical protein